MLEQRMNKTVPQDIRLSLESERACPRTISAV